MNRRLTQIGFSQRVRLEWLEKTANLALAVQTGRTAESLFPFRLCPLPADQLVAVSGRLDLLRHGLDDELIMLKEST